MKKLLTLILILCIYQSLHAKEDEILKKLCTKISVWKPGELGPTTEEYGDQMSVVDFAFVASKVALPKRILVDTRGEKERAKGLFAQALSLRAGLKDGDADDFSKDAILEKAAKFLNRPKLSWSELSKFNFLLFCNGEKCPKSPRAACALREFGISGKQVHIVPISFDDLHAQGLPLYFLQSRL